MVLMSAEPCRMFPAGSRGNDIRQRTMHGLHLLLIFVRISSADFTHTCGWFGNLVAKALDLQLAGCEFNSGPRRC